MGRIKIMDIILDTHAFIWLMEGDKTLNQLSRKKIDECSKEGTLFISAISIWEIAMLQNKGKISLTLPIQKWVEKAMILPSLKIIPIDESIAIESCKLPGDFHGDPADRMIVATSRLFSIPLVTRDKKILIYGNQAFVNVIEC